MPARDDIIIKIILSLIKGKYNNMLAIIETIQVNSVLLHVISLVNLIDDW